MLRLALTKATATLTNFNPSTEKSGPDDVPYTALRISVPIAADALSYFAVGLKDFIYDDKAPRDLADGLAIRDPHMVLPLKRDETMENATLAIEYGLDKPMSFADAKLKDFQLSPKPGGTVVVDFTALVKPDAWKDIPQLYLLQRKGITITVTPAELQEMQEAA